MVEQLRSFDMDIPTASLSYQAGGLQGSFTFAQIVTSVLWGRAADSPLFGWRTVLLIGFVGTGMSCVGVGFSQSFVEMITSRVLGGAVNGTVGAARTMVAESVQAKWHSGAFLAAACHPHTFSGSYAASLLEAFPYALPSLLYTTLLFMEAGLVVAFPDETAHEEMLGRPDGRHKRSQNSHATAHLPFSIIWTANALWTLLSVAIFDLHMGAFSGLWIIFLSTSRGADRTASASATRFTGGLSFSLGLFGSSLAILGIPGLMPQILRYPWANTRFGLMRCFWSSLLVFPFAYLLAPYLALLPSATAAPQPASGVLVWLGISLVLMLQVSARTFALPASIILVNNASPHPRVLGMIHGVGQSVSSAMRTLGPVAGGYWFGLGLEKGMVGLGWWAIAGISALGCIASLWVKNESGYEVLLQEEDTSSGESSRG
ncbi:uncharacterized protein M421DRAFT_100723 [Didymella exigua CBS 183.55]|uniref:MFS general substrate transporter n=1 Tax=Didymella exigua CBS 183.55 TaxID=1150837 RepID=A0A6A5RMJ1_9PLEO|nr:uncharacterized protein M421DRAFT_100723 [Didymella exigua CBS 183.55]KAF1929002.1 hypothetical protein M421DRAFT_100723 [Didymella exigua CBS 183.55]